jgi:hypothetical protein
MKIIVEYKMKDLPKDLADMMALSHAKMMTMVINAAYGRALDRYVKTTKKIPHANILSVGCNAATDSNIQTQFVLDNLVQQDGTASYLGIDLDELGILMAKGDLPNPVYDRQIPDRATYKFRCMDATNLEDLAEDRFDIAFFSHPETYSQKSIWGKIVDEVKSVQNEKGLVVASFLFDNEVNPFCEMLGDDYTVNAIEENVLARTNAEFNITPHKYIVVAEKSN